MLDAIEYRTQHLPLSSYLSIAKHNIGQSFVLNVFYRVSSIRIESMRLEKLSICLSKGQWDVGVLWDTVNEFLVRNGGLLHHWTIFQNPSSGRVRHHLFPYPFQRHLSRDFSQSSDCVGSCGVCKGGRSVVNGESNLLMWQPSLAFGWSRRSIKRLVRCRQRPNGIQFSKGRPAARSPS